MQREQPADVTPYHQQPSSTSSDHPPRAVPAVEEGRAVPDVDTQSEAPDNHGAASHGEDPSITNTAHVRDVLPERSENV